VVTIVDSDAQRIGLSLDYPYQLGHRAIASGLGAAVLLMARPQPP
jgi:hypothetical protein